MSKFTVTVLLLASLLAGSGCNSTPAPVGERLRVVPPITITEAERFRDGGSLRLQFVDEQRRAVIVHMDFRYGGPRQGEVLWVPRGTNTAQKLIPGGEQEADLIAVLRQWVNANVPAETQAKVADQAKPGGTDQEYLAWLVVKMIRTLEGRSGKPAH